MFLFQVDHSSQDGKEFEKWHMAFIVNLDIFLTENEGSNIRAIPTC